MLLSLNTQETLCFKKHSTDVLFCTPQLSSGHNPTRVTKPSSRGTSGKVSLMTCQLAALCKRVLSRLSWTRAVSFPNKPVAIRRGISRVFNCQRPSRSNQSVPIVGKWLRYAFCVCHAMRSGGRRDAVPTSALPHNRGIPPVGCHCPETAGVRWESL